MSENTNKEKDTGMDLAADELAASLSRQISGEEDAGNVNSSNADNDTELSLKDDLLDVLEEEIPEEDPDTLIRELQMAVDRELSAASEPDAKQDDFSELNLAESDNAEAKVTEQTGTDAIEAEQPEINVTEAKQPETENPEAAEAEQREANVPEAKQPEAEKAESEAAEQPAANMTEAEQPENDGTEEVKTELENTDADETEQSGTEKGAAGQPEEEAFDQEDEGVVDVSEGVRALSDAPTEELPGITGQNAVNTEESSEKSDRTQKKEDKKRRKQEAAEEKARAKQEAADEKARAKQEARELKKQRKAEKKANKKKGAGKIVLLILLVLIAAAAIVYLALANRYKTVFFDGTVINGADCTGLTVEEAETVVTRQLDDYELTITFRDGNKEVISGESIDFEYVSDGSVQEINESQIPVLWLTAFFEEYSYEATAAASFDSLKLAEAVTALDECNLVNMSAPVDAYLSYNEENNALEIVPEEQGNKFELSALIEAIDEAVSSGVTELDVEELAIYETPARTSEDEELISQRDEMNEIISGSVTYSLPSGTEKVLDADTLVNWLSVDEAGNYSFDESFWSTNLNYYVEELAREVNTSDATADFTTINGAVMSLDNYLQGWLIDEASEAAQLAEELAVRTVTTREPIYAQRAYSDENNGIGNTYVEIDLSQQHLWVVENGTAIMETDIVSGTMVYETYTPEGIYPLYGKQEGRYLRGEQYADGSYEYVSWVDYWMPFNGGIGLHDASWRTQFGGSIYYSAGSHGCINMPSYMAAQLFDWITAGTPVICYYSAGYSLAG
ncbi:MAG: L,D-transpeptidase family protein [Lachnospiraceae bacterium]|nr:L,D-transpeptidase family protein [Lachnospiraceae bacterium]